jgi:lipopolysaccharide/colanic/teichoic acid biosynthesis glycosyltransferase
MDCSHAKQTWMIRFFDIIISLYVIVLLLPVIVVIGIIISLDSRGGVFFVQTRVGKYGRDFNLIKFRTMRAGAEQHGALTVGARDSRITAPGILLRRFKLDELPQLFNVLKGDMSLVGPRPEVRRYVDLYTPAQYFVLYVKPGITDYASIEYMDENEILGNSPDPELTYITEVMPAKIELNRRFIEHPGTREYFTILLKTIIKIAGPGRTVPAEE